MVRRSVIYMIQEKTRQNLIASLYKAEYLSETRPKVLIELLQKKQVLKLLFDLGTSFG
uniref:Uncharacterized protein n=1 Tax=Rhizophagus irregularis (strain DAOM 181602 / DAOM 197198 / MUCL 43194) TaxID=747089 RepID=U9SM98_RHIID